MPAPSARSRSPSLTGETLGLVGLRGAGHHTVGRAIFGHTRIASGRLTLDGEPIAPQSPAEAMAKGVGFVSSRRAEESLASNLNVRENIYMNPAASGKGVLEFIPRATELNEARGAVRRFSIKAAGVEEPVATLSGGNQQKVVLARWMEAHVKLIILEEPTIGVDVGAKADIYHLLQLSLRKGLAALLISSDFEEVERICHRALVFSRGQVAAEIPGHAPDHRRLDLGRVGGKLDRRATEQRHEPQRRPLVQLRRYASDFRMGPACPVRPVGDRLLGC